LHSLGQGSGSGLCGIDYQSQSIVSILELLVLVLLGGKSRNPFGLRLLWLFPFLLIRFRLLIIRFFLPLLQKPEEH